MPLSKFESMLKTNEVYFFDTSEFELIVEHYLNVGKHALAKKALQLGLGQHPESINLKLLKVELFIFDNEIEKAVKLLTDIEAIEPHNDEVFIQKATILSKHKKHKEAIAILKESLEFVQDPVDVWAMIGMEYLYLDDYENARFNFAKCIDVDFEDYSSLYNIVYCFEMEENYEESIIYLRAYINKNPYSEVAWHQLGKQYYELNRFEEALISFEYAVLIDDSFIGGYLEKAKTLEHLQRFEEAIENYLITLELDDPTAYVYIKVGECYTKLEQIEIAIKYYKKAVYEDPLLDRGWLLLIDAYSTIKDYDKALYYVNKALQIDDSNATYWRKNAEINSHLEFYDEAIKAFHMCINLGDIDIEVYIALVDVLIASKDFENALIILLKARKVYKDFAEIEYRLFGLFKMKQENENAFNHLQKGLKVDFDYHTTLQELFPEIYTQKEIQNFILSFRSF